MAPRRPFLLIGLLFIFTVTVLAYLSLTGSWYHYLFDHILWRADDPSGWYIPSGIELLSHDGRLLFSGHPGLPLQIIIFCVAKALYFLSFAWVEGVSYLDFCTYRYPWIVGALKFFFICLTVLGAKLCCMISEEIFGDRRSALFSAMAFLFNFAIVFYSSTISPDLLGIHFFLLAIYAICRLTKDNQTSPGFTTLLGVSASAAFFTKMTVLYWILPLAVVPFYGTRERARYLAIATTVTLLTSLFFISFMNWNDYMDFWRNCMGGTREAPMVQGALDTLSSGIKNFFSSFNPTTRAGFVNVVLAPIISVGGLGLYQFLKTGSYPRALKLAFVIPIILTLPVWVFRGAGSAFHYLLPVIAIAAIFTGKGLGICSARIKTNPAFLLIAILSPSLATYVSMKTRDIESYNDLSRQTVRAVLDLGYGKKLPAEYGKVDVPEKLGANDQRWNNRGVEPIIVNRLRKLRP